MGSFKKYIISISLDDAKFYMTVISSLVIGGLLSYYVMSSLLNFLK